MATSRESFPTLENGTGDGVVLRQVIEGDSSAGKNGQLAFAFKDQAGNAILPTLSPQGAFYIDNTGAGVDKRAYGTYVPTTTGPTTGAGNVVVLTMTNGKTYTELNIQVACRRDAFFQLVYDNGTTKVPLMAFITGPGQYTIDSAELHFTATAPATGTNTLSVVGYCFDRVTDMFATLSCVESV